MENSSNVKNSILSGIISGSITATTLQPLEYIKTQLQQPENTKNNQLNQKRNIRIIISDTMISNQNKKVNLLNLSKFWSGLSPSIIRSIPVAGIFFGCVDFLKHTDLLSHSISGDKYQLIHSFLIGTISRTIANVLTHPLGLIKTRFESDLYNYKSIRVAFKAILKIEGVLGLYKGLGATLVRDISFSGIYFALYTKMKHALSKDIAKTTFKEHSSLFYASCALFSSTLACALTQPPDVVRSYMQLNPNKYNSLVATIKYIYSRDGMRGFFSGFLPRSSRRILISVMSWTIYEKLKIKNL